MAGGGQGARCAVGQLGRTKRTGVAGAGQGKVAARVSLGAGFRQLKAHRGF